MRASVSPVEHTPRGRANQEKSPERSGRCAVSSVAEPSIPNRETRVRVPHGAFRLPSGQKGRWVMKHVVVRSSGSGVWCGQLVSCSDANRVVKRKDARRAGSWEGALSCSELANNGPKSGKISEAVANVKVFDVLEVIDASEDAIAAWKKVEPWHA